jgi:hypothetical protein
LIVHRKPPITNEIRAHEGAGNMAKPSTIGGENFDNEDEARKFIRKVLYRHPLKAPIVPDHAFLLELLNRHPRAAEKIGVGVKHFTVDRSTGGTQCFHITRVDDSGPDDFSFEKCL